MDPDRKTGLEAPAARGWRPRRHWGWRRGRVLAGLAAVAAWLLVFPRTVPDVPGRPGSLLETFLPWLGLAVPLLLVPALVRRSLTALVALALLSTGWLGRFGGALPPPGAAPYDLTVVQHNVSDENPDPAGTARALMAAGPQLVALEELTPAALPAYRAQFAARYPHHAVHGTVGLWSAYPLRDVRPLDIAPAGFGAGWQRGLRATAVTPHGEVAVLVAHLPSVRLAASTGFGSGPRDESAALLGRAIAAEEREALILLGDLNATVDDRGLAPVASRLRPPPPSFVFSWPAGFPLARIDQVMTRSADVTRLWTLPATGSDHLPVGAHIRL
jgi:vancomycin resistance protein VanJ